MSKMLILILALLFFICLSYLILKWYYMNYKYYTTGVHKVRGPRCFPIIGHALEVILLFNSEILEYIANSCSKYGGIVKLFIGFTPSIVITDYKLTEMIMNSTTITKKANTAKCLNNWLSSGLLLSYGEKWRIRRKLITQAFHFQSLEQYVDIFNSASNTLVAELTQELALGNNTLDIYQFISLLTLDVICESAMGTKINAQIQKQSEYINSVKEMDRIMLLRVVSLTHHFDQIYQFTKEARMEKKCLEIIHGYTDMIINQRRNEILKNTEDFNRNNVEKDIDLNINTKGSSFLDTLLQSTIDDQTLSDNDIREEVDTFMFAGHNTTASAISFCLYSLAQYPEIQEKVLQEQQTIFGNNKSGSSTYNNLCNMTYLSMVIKETLRLFPSIPMYGREVTEDFKYDDMIFKKGMDLMIYPYAIHRNPEYFPNPERFWPERFSDKNSIDKKPFAYIPFAAGSRNCIGQKFAVLEMKATISKLIRFFEILPVANHKMKLVPETVLKSDNGIIIELRHRKDW